MELIEIWAHQVTLTGAGELVYQTLGKNATIQQVTTMLPTSKNVLFLGYNHLLTTGTGDPTLWLLPQHQRIISTGGEQVVMTFLRSGLHGGYLVDSGFWGAVIAVNFLVCRYRGSEFVLLFGIAQGLLKITACLVQGLSLQGVGNVDKRRTMKSKEFETMIGATEM